MGLPRHPSDHHRTSSSPMIFLVSALALLLFFFTSSSTALERGKGKVSVGRNEMPRHDHHHRIRGADHGRYLRHHVGWESSGVLWMGLGGPGSSPPTCRSKCGRCAPCRAVHVPIHPGRVSIPLEYYPEAWRCKCGNAIFMP